MSVWDFQISWSGSWGSRESAGLLRWNIQMWRWHWPHEGPDTILDEAQQGHWVKKWRCFDSPTGVQYIFIHIYGYTIYDISDIQPKFMATCYVHDMYLIFGCVTKNRLPSRWQPQSTLIQVADIENFHGSVPNRWWKPSVDVNFTENFCAKPST